MLDADAAGLLLSAASRPVDRPTAPVPIDIARGIFRTPSDPASPAVVELTYVSRDSAYRSEMGLVHVDDATGRIGRLRPGSPQYLRAAMSPARRIVVLTRSAEPGTAVEVTLPAGAHFALYLIPNGTGQSWDRAGARRPPQPLLSVAAANPGRRSHLRPLTGGRWAWEDLSRRSDWDFNDLVFRLSRAATPANRPPSVTISRPFADVSNRVGPLTGAADDDRGVSQVIASLVGPAGWGPRPLAFDGGTGAFTLETGLAADGSADGVYTARVVARDRDGAESAPAETRWVYDTRPPVIELTTTPPPGPTNSVPVLQGRLSDNLSGVARLEASLDGGAAQTIPLEGPTFSYTTPIAPGGRGDGPHTVGLRAIDLAGNSSPTTTFSFVLDATPPAVSLRLAPESDSPPAGDGRTTAAAARLVGQTDPDVAVTLVGTAWTTRSDGTGAFAFDGVPLSLGSNPFTARAVDAAGNAGEGGATVTREGDCGFEAGLVGWTVGQSGGSGPGAGTVAHDAAGRGRAVLTEGNSFEVTLRRSFVVPEAPTRLGFQYADLAFDTSDTSFINDAFEVALVGENGRSLVPTFAPGRDAFLNATEGMGVATGPGVTTTGGAVSLDVSGLVPGSVATLIFRLVNNDSDTTTAVAVVCTAGVPFGEVRQTGSGDPGTPATTGEAARPSAAMASQQLDASQRVGSPPGGTPFGSIQRSALGDTLLDADARATFTTSEDFLSGTLYNVNALDVPDELRLDPAGEVVALPIIWIANSGEDTVSKFDTRTGIERGRYRTGPDSASSVSNPSRIAVASNGDAWVANRGGVSYSTVVKVLEYGFIDRNGNGVVDTCRDLDGDGRITGAEVLPWDSNSDGQPDDERIALVVPVGHDPADWNRLVGVTGPRGLAIDASNKLWVGLYSRAQYEVYDAETGELESIVPTSHGAYGAVIDADGMLWSTISGAPPYIMQIDTNTRRFIRTVYVGSTYAITLDPQGDVWTSPSGLTGGYSLPRFSPTEDKLYQYAVPRNYATGITVDREANIWVADLGFDVMRKFTIPDDPSQPAIATEVPLTFEGFTGINPRAASVDADGYVWTVTHEPDGRAWKIDPATNSVVMSVATGSNPYNYSDMTGQVHLSSTTRYGTWTEIVDGEYAGKPWASVGLELEEPSRTHARVRVRAADRRDDLAQESWREVPAGSRLPHLAGRYLEVEVALLSGTRQSSPAVKAIEVVSIPPPQLEVTSPADTSTAAGATVLLAGLATAARPVLADGTRASNAISHVSVDGRPVEAIDALGRFFTRVPVLAGRNSYTVEATDIHGQTTTSVVSMIGLEPRLGEVAFERLADITASFRAEYARTSFQEERSVLHAAVAVRNTGNYPVQAPLYVAVANLSDPEIVAVGAAGVTPDGLPYYDFTGQVPGRRLSPDGTTQTLDFAFLNPGGRRFTYDLVFFGLLNRPPEFVSVPAVQASAGEAFEYVAAAVDPDGDGPAYTLVQGPEGMTIDASAGRVAWTPRAEDVGTHDVTIRADDGRGGRIEQRFTLTASDAPPNRPPVVTSLPEFKGYVGRPYAYDIDAADADGDALTYAFARATTRPRPLGVTNPSFEDPFVGSGYAAISGWTVEPPGWNAYTLGYRSNYFPSGVPDGANVAWVLTTASLSQKVSERLRPQTTYTLTVDVGRRVGAPFGGYRLELLAGGVLLADATTPAPSAEGSWVPASLTARVGPGHEAIGGELEIRLVSLGAEVFFDNVRLADEEMVVTPAPVPDGMSIDAGTGLISWTPRADQVGTADVTVQVRDDRGGFAYQDYSICVTPDPENRRPAIVSQPVTHIAGVPNRSRIVVANDEWTLSNAAFTTGYDTERFVRNVADYFTGGRPGAFLAYSNNVGLVGNQVARAMAAAGHSWTLTTQVPFTVAELQPYDAVFVGGYPASNAALAEYVRGGGNVYLFGGSGSTGAFGDAVAEARAWNDFLGQFGLSLEQGYARSPSPIVSQHPLFAGITELYHGQRVGQPISDLNAADTRGRVVVEEAGKGWYAVYEGFLPRQPGGYAYDVDAVDANGDSLRYTLLDAPHGMTIEEATGVIRWPDHLVAYGEHTVRVRVHDGRGDSDEQAFVLRVDASQAAIEGTARQATEADLIGPLPYRSQADSPFDLSGLGTTAYLEDFEDHLLNTPGVRVLGADLGVSSQKLGWDFWDSVDGDDGNPADGSNRRGDALSANGPGGITITFAESQLGGLPTFAGAVWTDGTALTSFEAFDSFGRSLGKIGPLAIADASRGGTTGEDRFFGVRCATGISAIRLHNSDGEIEVDHIQYGGIVARPSVSTQVSVPGYANLYLAGMPDGTRSGTDVVPAHAPIEVGGFGLIAGTSLLFSAHGATAHGGAFPLQPPDGTGYQPHAMENGIAGLTAPLSSLVGLFLGPDAPTRGPVPPSLDFRETATTIGTSYESLSPSLKQPFFIGDGFTGSGILQRIVVPEGATRLFLGCVDGANWANNVGSLTVRVSTVEAPGGPWTVYLDADGDGLRDSDEPSTVTHADGSYRFDGLDAGRYTVAVDRRGGWRTVSPESGSITAIVAPDATTRLADFVVERAPAPSGISPSLAPQPDIAAQVGQTLRVAAQASDADSPQLTFNLPQAPAGMTVHTSLGVVVWTPTSDQVGSHQVVLRVRDPEGNSALQSFTIIATVANQSPVVTSTPPGPARAGLPYEYRIEAQDAEADALTYRLDDGVPGPVRLAADQRTGVVSWTPAESDVGEHPVAVLVTDAAGNVARHAFTLAVSATAANRAPELRLQARSTAWSAVPYAASAGASDPDGDPVRFTLSQHPEGMRIDERTGEIRWTPTPQQGGAHLVTVRVGDGRPGGEAERSFRVDVVPQGSNAAPWILTPPRIAAVVGRSYEGTLVANDPDGDPVAWSLVDAPRGMSIDRQRGTLRWTPAGDQLGPQRVVVAATDPFLATGTQSFVVLVSCVNRSPEVTSRPATEAWATDPYVYAVRADDPEGDALRFTLLARPDGMTIDERTGLVRWVPTVNQGGGTYTVAVRVDDGQGNSATQSYQVPVSATPRNRPPVIDSRPPTRVVAGTPFRYDVTALDPEGDAVRFGRGPSFPGTMTLDEATGRVVWDTTQADIGGHVVTIVAIDAGGARATQSFLLSVEANAAPALDPIPSPQSVAAGGTFRLDARAADANGDPLAFELRGQPGGMTVDGLGRIRWAVPPRSEGTFAVDVLVRDPLGLEARRSFVLAVVPDAKAPRVVVAATPNPVDAGAPATFRVVASDDARIESLALFVGGQPLALRPDGTATRVMGEIGPVPVVAVATDVNGNRGEAAIVVEVVDPAATNRPKPGTPGLPPHPGTSDPGDKLAPTVLIASPAADSRITTLTPVLGTVDDPEDNLWYYRVVYARVDAVDLARVDLSDPDWVLLGQGTREVAGGQLAVFDPTALARDAYVLLVAAFDADGRGSFATSTVSVEGNLQLGTLRLEFTDLQVPLAGIPITVTRVYDSTQAGREGDFGHGWSLGVRDAWILETAPPGTRYVPDRTRVYLTTPDGRRVGFTYKERAISASLFGVISEPYFQSDPGVPETLSVPEKQVGGGGTVGAISRLYNPDTFILTTRDGTSYTYDQLAGLRTVDDPNGNRLTYTADGIFHSGGASVRFDRDHRGRITRITDPAGNTLDYRYDAAGDLVAFDDQDKATAPVRYGYLASPAHFLDTIADPTGRRVFDAEFDARGQLVASTDGTGARRTQAFDAEARTGVTRDGNGNTTELTFDARGNVLVETLRGRDGAVARVRRYEYADPRNPDRETRVYDPRHTDAAPVFFEYAYDDAGNRVRETNPLGTVTTTTHDPRGNVLTRRVRSADGTIDRTETSVYDAAGHLTAFVDAAGFRRGATYDAKGRIASTTDAEGNTTRFDYKDGCACGSPARVIHPDGASRSFTYNRYGQVTSVTDELGHKTTYTYDPRGLLLAIYSDAAGHLVAEFGYDALGNRTLVRDPLGNETRFVHGANGEVLEDIITIDGRELKRIYGYDGNGNLVYAEDRNGRVRRMEYDAADNLVLERWYEADGALARTTRSEYDAAGNRTLAATHDSTIIRRYDGLNRITFESNAGTPDVPLFTLGHTYDAAGNPTRVEDNYGVVQRSAYDARDLLVRRSWEGPDITPALVAFAYDGDGRRTRIDRYEGLSEGPVSIQTATTYTPRGLTDTITHARMAGSAVDAVLDSYDYDYDGRGLVAFLRHGAQEVTYGYDVLGQLTDVDYSDNSVQPDEWYRYDANGNRTSSYIHGTGYVTGPYNRIMSDGQHTYQYDAEGNITRRDAITTDSTLLFSVRLQPTAVTFAGRGGSWPVRR